MNVQRTQKLTKTNRRTQHIAFDRDAPVAQLPNEILILILLEANSEPVSVSRVKTTKRSRDEWGNSHLPETTGYCNMAVVISHVCQQWRSISLDIPALWTAFYYVEYLSNTRKILQRLDAYLERSGTQLLDIWIDLRGSRRNLVDRNQSLMTKTLRHINRWRSFAFFPDNAFSLLNFFIQLKHLAAPNLETFCTSAVIGEESRSILNQGGLAGALSSSQIFKKGAPKLSILRMDMAGIFSYLPPLSNIITLYIHNEDIVKGGIGRQFLSTSSLANLINLTLDGVFIRDYRYDYFGPTPPIVIPMLKHLRLCNQFIHRSDLYLTLPLLETLTFYKVQYDEGTGTHRAVDTPNLHSLFLVDSNILDDSISLTRMTSNITTVVLSDSRTRSAGIRPIELLDYDHAQQGWPMLQDITVNLRNVGKFDLEFYLRCFQERPKVPAIALRIDSSLLADWQTRSAPRLALLEDLCTIETLDASDPTIPSPWPIDTPNGAFRNLYEKLDPPFIKRYSAYYSNV